MDPGNLAKTGVENPDRATCRVAAIPPEPSQHHAFVTGTRKYKFFFLRSNIEFRNRTLGSKRQFRHYCLQFIVFLSGAGMTIIKKKYHRGIKPPLVFAYPVLL
jgi:hypothetical protein